MERIGLFGGSFDPIHVGHLLVAEAACEEFALERLFFIPAAISPFKPESQPAPAEQRLCLLRLALAGRSHFSIDGQEIERGGTSFSVETARTYRNRFPAARLYWLIGADHVPTLTQWRDAGELAGMVEFLIIPRPGELPVEVPKPFVGHRLSGFPLGVSSSQIRQRVRDGLTINTLTPSPVAEAIRNNGLYL